MTKNNATVKEYFSFHTGSSVAIQREGGVPWMHATILEHGSEDYIGRLYRISIIRT